MKNILGKLQRKHTSFLQEDSENKSKFLQETKNEISLLRQDFDLQNNELVSVKEKSAILKVQLSIMDERGNTTQSEWTAVDTNCDRKPKIPEVLLVRTSNISKIDPSKLSTK